MCQCAEFFWEGYEAGKASTHEYWVQARGFTHEVKELDLRGACICGVSMVQVNPQCNHH